MPDEKRTFNLDDYLEDLAGEEETKAAISKFRTMNPGDFSRFILERTRGRAERKLAAVGDLETLMVAPTPEQMARIRQQVVDEISRNSLPVPANHG
jgi:hypothetical protein